MTTPVAAPVVPSTSASLEPTPTVTTPTSPSTTAVPVQSSEPAPTAIAVATAPIVEPTPGVEVAPPVVEPAPAAVVPPVEVPPVASGEYELELAENSPLSQGDLDVIATIASERGLNKEQADAIIKEREDFYNKGSESFNVKNNERLTSMANELNTHADFSGENRVASFASINRAVQAFGDENLTKAINDPNIGNNVHLASFLKKVGEALGQDTIQGINPITPSEDAANPMRAKMKKLYPAFFEEK